MKKICKYCNEVTETNIHDLCSNCIELVSESESEEEEPTTSDEELINDESEAE